MLEQGRTVGRYVVEKPLGTGAMGVVYRATDTMLRREVALKVLEPSAGSAVGIDPAARARFLRECRAAAALMHPNIVAVFDVGEHEGLPFLAMELVVGTTLRALIGDASVALPMRIRWLVEVARALAVAHDRGLIHRDVKPENVLVTREGTAKLADFGIVKEKREYGPQSFRTKTGDVLGTPDYMAPEQWAASRDIDGRADQYAWGLVAWELLAGRPLPMGRPPPIQTVAAVPDVVAAVVTRAIEYQREGRFPSMAPLIAELEPFVAEPATEGVRTRSMNPPAALLEEIGPATVPDPGAFAQSPEIMELGIAPTMHLPPIAYPTPPPPPPPQHPSTPAPAHPSTPAPAHPSTPAPSQPSPQVEIDTHRRGRIDRPPSSSRRSFFVAMAITGAIALVIALAFLFSVRRRRRPAR